MPCGAQPVLVVIDDAQWLDDESAGAVVRRSPPLRRTRSRWSSPCATHQTPPVASNISAGSTLSDSATQRPSNCWRVSARPLTRPSPPTSWPPRGATPALVELPAALTVEQLRGAAPLPDPLPIGDRLSGLFAAEAGCWTPMPGWCCSWPPRNGAGIPLLRRAAEIAGELSWDEAVARAEASGLVTFAPTVEFRHPLVRSAVYYSAAAADRRRAHAALAGALDTDADADRRAWHLGPQQPAWTSGSPERWKRQPSELGGEGRICRGGVSLARFELTPEREHAAERLLEAARAELTAGHGPQARALLERARASGLASDRQADAEWTEALVHIVAGDVRAPTALLARALPDRAR